MSVSLYSAIRTLARVGSSMFLIHLERAVAVARALCVRTLEMGRGQQ